MPATTLPRAHGLAGTGLGPRRPAVRPPRTVRAMAHRALTLKYRPQVFADLVGQEHVTRVLMAALESGRVAQAFLFTGSRGVGKTTSARILAKALNCERRTPVSPGE